MTTPQPLESKRAAPRRIGLHRYSVAEFLIALVVVFIGLPFIEPFDKDKHIEAILMALVLVSGVLVALCGADPLRVDGFQPEPMASWKMWQKVSGTTLVKRRFITLPFRS